MKFPKCPCSTSHPTGDVDVVNRRHVPNIFLWNLCGVQREQIRTGREWSENTLCGIISVIYFWRMKFEGFCSISIGMKEHSSPFFSLLFISISNSTIVLKEPQVKPRKALFIYSFRELTTNFYIFPYFWLISCCLPRSVCFLIVVMPFFWICVYFQIIFFSFPVSRLLVISKHTHYRTWNGGSCQEPYGFYHA